MTRKSFIEDDVNDHHIPTENQNNSHLHIGEDNNSSKSDTVIVPMVDWSGASRAGQVHLVVHFLSLRKLDILVRVVKSIVIQSFVLDPPGASCWNKSEEAVAGPLSYTM